MVFPKEILMVLIKSGESTDSDGTFDWDDFDLDAGAIKLDLRKVGSIPGSYKQTQS